MGGTGTRWAEPEGSCMVGITGLVRRCRHELWWQGGAGGGARGLGGMDRALPSGGGHKVRGERPRGNGGQQ